MKEFFTQLWEMILDSKLLDLLGAVMILIAGWLLALWLSRRVSYGIRKISAKNSPDGHHRVLPSGAEHVETVTGKVIYYVVLAFAVLGCFSVLHLDAAAMPLRDFISSVALYLPNLIGALLLVLAARITAGVVRSAVRGALMKSELHKQLTDRTGLSDPVKSAQYTAQTMYYTVFLFFLPAILNVLKIYGITEPLQTMFEKIMIFLPRLAVAAAILFLGLWVAKFAGRAAAGLAVIGRLDELGKSAGMSFFSGQRSWRDIFEKVTYILVALPVIISALTALQIEALTRSVAGFLDKLLNAAGDLIGAGILLLGAALLGRFLSSVVVRLAADFGVDNLADGMGIKENKPSFSLWLGKLTGVVIWVLALLAVCDLLQFPALAELIRTFAAFGGNILLSILVMLIGIWLAHFAASAVEGKCSPLLTVAVRITVIVFTAAVAVGNMNIGGVIVETAFALILGAACVAAAVAFGLGGREAAALLLKEWVEKLRK